MPLRYEDVIGLWREGARRLLQAEPRVRPALDRVIDVLVVELRRRLGGPFTVDELAQLYERDGIDWCFDVATRIAPGNPEAWDLTTISGAAFARYLREASDYGGGGRRVVEE